jgi:hypothetical protein
LFDRILKRQDGLGESFQQQLAQNGPAVRRIMGEIGLHDLNMPGNWIAKETMLWGECACFWRNSP